MGEKRRGFLRCRGRGASPGCEESSLESGLQCILQAGKGKGETFGEKPFRSPPLTCQKHFTEVSEKKAQGNGRYPEKIRPLKEFCQGPGKGGVGYTFRAYQVVSAP